MRFKDFIEDIKAFEEWQKANKPKDDKKKDPDAWTTADYVTFVSFVFAVTIPIGTCIGLSYIVELIRVLHH